MKGVLTSGAFHFLVMTECSAAAMLLLHLRLFGTRSQNCRIAGTWWNAKMDCKMLRSDSKHSFNTVAAIYDEMLTAVSAVFVNEIIVPFILILNWHHVCYPVLGRGQPRVGDSGGFIVLQIVSATITCGRKSQCSWPHFWNCHLLLSQATCHWFHAAQGQDGKEHVCCVIAMFFGWRSQIFLLDALVSKIF